MGMLTLQVALVASLAACFADGAARLRHGSVVAAPPPAEPPAPMQFVFDDSHSPAAVRAAVRAAAPGAPAPAAPYGAPGASPAPGAPAPAPGAPGTAPGAPGAPGAPAAPAAPTAVSFAPSFALEMTVPQRWAPRIISISPNSASLCGGTKVTIHGADFSPVPSDNKVFLGTLDCPIVAASKTDLHCVVPHLPEQKVDAPHQSIPAPVKVYVKGTPSESAAGADFTFAADSTPTIEGFGPTTGQGGEIVLFQGRNFGDRVSISIGGKACDVRQVSDAFLQCVPAPDVAGIADIEVYAGPLHGYACQAPKSPPLKFIHLLTLQSVQPAEWGADASGPMDGRGVGSLTIVGQGLSDSVVLKLCGGAASCEPTSGVRADKPEFHEGDNSFQTLTCTPSAFMSGPSAATTAAVVSANAVPLPAASGRIKPYNQTCELTAEAAGGMLKSVVQGAWTYTWTPSPTSTPPPIQSPWHEIHEVGRGAVAMRDAEPSLPSSVAVSQGSNIPAIPLASHVAGVSSASSKKTVAGKRRAVPAKPKAS